MFPIPFNFPFRKANGDISTIGAEISGGGGGSSYTLPTASETVKGGIKIGTGLSMEGDTLNNTNPTPATPYTLPTASDETLGGIKVGSGLSIDENGVLSTSGGSTSKYVHNVVLKSESAFPFCISFKFISETSTPASNLNDVISLMRPNFTGNNYCPASGGILMNSVILPIVYAHIISATNPTFELYYVTVTGATSNVSGSPTFISDVVEVL